MSRTQLNKRASEKLAEIFSTGVLNHKDKGELTDEELQMLKWHEECHKKAVEYILNLPNKDRKYSFVNLVSMGLVYYKQLIEERCFLAENKEN